MSGALNNALHLAVLNNSHSMVYALLQDKQISDIFSQVNL